MVDGDLGPGGTCFTAENVKAQSQWLTAGGKLFVLVPDTASDITVETLDGERRPIKATNNLVVTGSSDTVRYSVGDMTRTVKAAKRSR
jgi:hypothetical protein